MRGNYLMSMNCIYLQLICNVITDFNYARFKSDGRKLIIMFERIVLNFVDIDGKSNDIIDDLLTLEFDKPLPDFTHIGVDILEYNGKSF